MWPDLAKSQAGLGELLGKGTSSPLINPPGALKMGVTSTRRTSHTRLPGQQRGQALGTRSQSAGEASARND